MVVLAVPDEETLKRYAAGLKAAGIDHASVIEDAGPFADQVVSIGVRPTRDRDAIRRVVSDLSIAGRRRPK